MTQDKLALIRQSLAAAESSIKTAKQLLSELESGGLKPAAKDLPGLLGVFDGTSMVTEKGEVFPIPVNYASKSMLVVGDTLKLVEEDGEKRFKQIEHVKRHKTAGILHKKDGKYKVITPEGSYNVLSASVEHFKGDIGDEVVLHLPAGNLTTPWGAIESVNKKGELVEEKLEAPKKVEAKPLTKPSPKVEVREKPKAVKPVAVKAPPFKPYIPSAKPKVTPAVPKVEVKKEPISTGPALPPSVSDDELR